MDTATKRTTVHRHTDVNLAKGLAWPTPSEALMAGTIQGDKLVLVYGATRMAKRVHSRTRVVTCKRSDTDPTLWLFEGQQIIGSLD